MKHKLSITLAILGMFLLIQFIGLAVINEYSPIVDEQGEKQSTLPPIFQTPQPETQTGYIYYLIQIIPSFIIAILLVVFITKYKLKFFMKAWFFLVVILALFLTTNALLRNFLATATIASTLIAITLAFFKIYRPNFYTHNLTELMIYPGIAAIFVPILSPLTIILLLILISIYDIWAVWHSGIMQKMAKFQMEELNIFGGILITSASKKVREQIKKLKKSGKKSKKKFKVNLAILGGGDIVFPLITAGVFLQATNIFYSLFIIGGAFAGLAYLLFTAKKKFYPAMPFITAGIFLGIATSFLILGWPF